MEQKNKHLSEYPIFQVEDNKKIAIDVLWKDNEEIDLQQGNMRALAMCIGRTIAKSNLKRLEIFDIAAYKDWGLKSSYPNAFYSIGQLANGAAGVYVSNILDILAEKDFPFTRVAPIKDRIKAAAITFDGDWILNEAEKFFSFKEEDEPWIFYVTTNGTLMRQEGFSRAPEKFFEEDKKIKLVAAERGFFPDGYENLDIDQGLVVVYVTEDNKVGYSTYARSAATKEKAWFIEDEIFGLNYSNKEIVNIQIHRLNDYRMGINLTTKEKDEAGADIYRNYWHITERSYAAMAFRPELFNITNAIVHSPIYAYIDFTLNPTVIQPNWTWSINEEHTRVQLISDIPLKYYNGYEKYFADNGTLLGHSFFTHNIKQTDFEGIIQVLLVKNDDGDNIGFEVVFSEEIKKTFTLNFEPQPNIDFAAVINIESGGGLVTVFEPASHEFDFSNILTYNYNEVFEINNIEIKTLTAKTTYITTKEEAVSGETFEITNINIKNVSCNTVFVETKNEEIGTEIFEITNVNVKRLTVDNITVIPIVPV